MSYTTFTPTCSTVTESCGVTVASTDCSLNLTQCVVDAAGAQVLETSIGSCDPGKGCVRSSSTRLCNRQRCLDSTRLEVEVGCQLGATACSTRIVTCTFGCGGDICIIG
jgi:hypothetical protein